MISRRWKKRGQLALSFLVKIIAVMVSFMLISFSIGKFVTKAGPKQAEALCRESVNLRVMSTLNVKAAGAGLENVKYTPLTCKTIDEEISGTAEEVKQRLAEMSARCWWMMRNGRTADLFQNLPGTGGANRGFVCYTALLQDIKDADAFSGKELLTYMSTIKHPDLPEGGTYFDYIQYASGGPGRVVLLLTEQNGEPSFKERYGYEIVFVEKSGESNEWIGKVLTGGGTVAIVGGVVLGIATGGVSLAVAGLVLAGGTSVAGGGNILIDQFFEERDVSTIMIVDMSNAKMRQELHKNVYITDIAAIGEVYS